MAHHLILSEHYRRVLSPVECFNPLSPNCTACTSTELQLGTCTVLAKSQSDAMLGAVTAWGMFVCFLIPIVGVVARRTRVLLAGMAPIWGIALAAILQGTIPSIRPPGACMAGGQSCGMPSGHVITAYSTITFLFWMWGRDIHHDHKAFLKQMSTLLGAFLALVVAAFVIVQILMPIGRMVIFYHTQAQVGFGVLTGFLLGSFWFLLVVQCIGPFIGPRLSRYLKCIDWKDDWNYPSRMRDESKEKDMVSNDADA